MSFLFLCTLSLLLSESCCNLLCYNCSTTQHDPGAACVTAFQNHGLLSAETIQQLNAITVNCSKEAAFCFVRSSHSRARFAWLVQRGCYYPQSDKELSFLRSRCSHSQNTICDSLRKADSEYSMCLCNADHCNSAGQFHRRDLYIKMLIIIILNCIRNI